MYHALDGKRFAIEDDMYVVVAVKVLHNETVVEGKPLDYRAAKSRPLYFPVAEVARNLVNES